MPGGPATDLLDELVHQFSDPFAFYRELIQNSLDSGSNRIEVTIAFQPGRPLGLATASVGDWGEGMSRKVIEDYLLTKFRSSKEHDLTKIGKFGIGFVSVFSSDPDAVVVETGRDGESWRVLFKKDRSYELLKLDQPVEGTRVTLHKAMSAADYGVFASRSFEAVKRWCRHCESDIVFAAGKADGSALPEPAPVNEPFTIDAPFVVEHREEGTQIVAGVARTQPPISGLYNRGLTLLETPEAFVPGVAIKVASRWLEHTLTRDNVRRDANFSKAIAQATRLVKGPLHARLPEELRRCAADPAGASDWQTLFVYALGRLALKDTWLRQPGGGAIEGRPFVKALGTHQAVFVAQERTPLVSRLLASGVPVIEGVPGSPWITGLPISKSIKPALASERWVHAEPSPIPRAPSFCTALLAVLKLAGGKIERVSVTRVYGPTLELPFPLVEEPGKPEALHNASLSPFAARCPATLALDFSHEQLTPIEPLIERAPRLAALLVARKISVCAGVLDADRDWALTQWALG